jgi:hypothetical protein
MLSSEFPPSNLPAPKPIPDAPLGLIHFASHSPGPSCSERSHLRQDGDPLALLQPSLLKVAS